jgi:hypothetical protein
MISLKYYTYAYLRKDRTPYYIGKGSDNRIRSKQRNINLPKDKSRIIILKQNLTEEEAFKHEKYMIDVFGRKDLGTGILHNRTDGGEGCSGRIKTEEEREKIRARMCGENNPFYGKIYTKEERQNLSEKMSGKKTKELKKGIFSRTEEQKKEDRSKGGKVGGKNGGEKVKELKIGIFSRSEEQRILDARNGALVLKELNLGICSLTHEQLSENGKKGGKIAVKNLISQKWMCLETEFISTSAGLSHYQRKRGIDTSRRKRVL